MDKDLAVRSEDRVATVSRNSTGKIRIEEKDEIRTRKPTRPADNGDSSRYISTDLPSKFNFYDFKTLHIRHFVVQDLLAIYDARVKESFRGLVDVISATLLNHSALELTLEDFWYILYWHRINSYRKTKFTLEWECTEEKHLAWIANGKPVVNADGVKDLQIIDPDSVRNSEIVSKSNLKVVDVNLDKVNAIAEQIKLDYGLDVVPVKMGVYVQFLEEQEEQEALIKRAQEGETVELKPDSEAMLSRYAMVVDHGSTLVERRELLKSLEDPEIFMDIEEFLAVLNYGVTEKFNVKCKVCGASKEVTNSIDALVFLPHLRGAGVI